VRLGGQQGPSHPHTSPFPANPFPGGGDQRPEPADDGHDDHEETPGAPRRSWWRRLFGR